jgi:hypothetical protein
MQSTRGIAIRSHPTATLDEAVLTAARMPAFRSASFIAA